MAGAGDESHRVLLPVKYAKDIQARTQVFHERCLLDIVKDPTQFKLSIGNILND
jgi:hypothetical protein